MMDNYGNRSHSTDNGKVEGIPGKSLHFSLHEKKRETLKCNFKSHFNFQVSVLFSKYTLPTPQVQQIFQNQPWRFQSRAAFLVYSSVDRPIRLVF